MAHTPKWRRILALLVSALLLVALALLGRLSRRESYSVKKAKEAVLRQDLKTMRDEIANYIVDLQKAPQSMDDMIKGGYLRKIPSDPMTGRNDTWILQWSSDPKKPGIVNIHSGSQSISSEGTAYSQW